MCGVKSDRKRDRGGGGESSAFLGVILHKLFEMLEKLCGFEITIGWWALMKIHHRAGKAK